MKKSRTFLIILCLIVSACALSTGCGTRKVDPRSDGVDRTEYQGLINQKDGILIFYADETCSIYYEDLKKNLSGTFTCDGDYVTVDYEDENGDSVKIEYALYEGTLIDLTNLHTNYVTGNAGSFFLISTDWGDITVHYADSDSTCTVSGWDYEGEYPYSMSDDYFVVDGVLSMRHIGKNWFLFYLDPVSGYDICSMMGVTETDGYFAS